MIPKLTRRAWGALPAAAFAAGRGLAYEQWDVFTDRPLEGNALAVFLDARGLSDSQMQAPARETNLSETTFVFPGAADADVRIFTPREELPFAGHPTLGTAFALRAPGGERSGFEVEGRGAYGGVPWFHLGNAGSSALV
jgi:PhzF family phenazine biosynthesis protein